MKNITLLLTLLTFLMPRPAQGMDEWGNTQLMRYIRSGHPVEEIKVLINQKATIHARNRWQITPLMYAIQFNTPETTQLLIDSGAKVNAHNSSGATTLMWLSMRCDCSGKIIQGPEFQQKLYSLVAAGAHARIKNKKQDPFWDSLYKNHESYEIDVAKQAFVAQDPTKRLILTLRLFCLEHE